MNETTAAEEQKAPAFCKKSWDTNGVGAFVFGNGTTVSLDVNELSADQQFNLMMHGLMQKCGDSYASAKGDFALGVASVQKVCDQLLNDQWVASRASGGEGKPRSSELALALANIKKLDIAAVTAAVDAATDEQRKAWRKHPAIAAEIARMRAEKAAARAKAAETTDTADTLDLGL